MIIQTPEALLNVKMVYSLTIERRTKKTLLIPWSWKKPLTPPFVDEQTLWYLDMYYLGEDETKQVISWSGGLKRDVEKLKSDIISQLAAQDGRVMDTAFEDAISKLGSK